MFKTDNSLHVFVGPNSGGSANLIFQNDTTAASSAGSGSIFVVDEAGAAFDGVISGDFKIGQKNADGTFSFTPLLDFSKCTFKPKTHANNRSEASSVWGYNGTSGSIEAINSNRYALRVNFKNNIDMFSEQSDLHFFEYVSDANATQAEIVDYLAQTMAKNEKFNGYLLGKKRGSVKVERLSSATKTQASATGAIFTNGSKVVKCTNSDADATMIAGNYVAVAAAGGSPAGTDPIYKIESIDIVANTVTLDQPYAGAGSPTAVADNVLHISTAANVAAGNSGLKITGLEQEFKLGRLMDTQITFEITLDGWGDTTAVAATAAVRGDGYGRNVAELEWFGKGAEGAPYRHGIISNETDVTMYAVSTVYYDMLEIDATLADPNHAVAGSGVGKCKVVLAIPEDINGTDGAELNASFGVTIYA
tara:strand:- start:1987 stop:3246 length:1260 start_codon:yes stop_codon:yes gene_type:complete